MQPPYDHDHDGPQPECKLDAVTNMFYGTNY